MDPLNYLWIALGGIALFVCGWKARGKQRTVIVRPSEAQWALCESQSINMRTIARLKMVITHAEEANQDLRDQLAAVEIELAALRNSSTSNQS